MKKPRIPDATWQRVREDWMCSRDSVAAIATRHGMSDTTLSRHARTDKWPPRGSGANDPAYLARRLYAEITVELSASLRALQADGINEPPATAAQRGPLIRAHRRALIAVLDAGKPPAASRTRAPSPSTPTSGADFPALDLEAARKDILARLERLDAHALSDRDHP